MRAWLDIMKVRLLGRLQVASWRCPDDALDARMPPMVLLPLLDRAVRVRRRLACGRPNPLRSPSRLPTAACASRCPTAADRTESTGTDDAYAAIRARLTALVRRQGDLSRFPATYSVAQPVIAEVPYERHRPAILAEDEAVLRSELRTSSPTLWPELEIVAEAADGVAATRAFDEHAPDVLFLDIQMPGMTGLEVARLASGKCHVVFVTAYDKYAVAAFEQGAVDYVMKPFSAARIADTVARLKDRLRDGAGEPRRHPSHARGKARDGRSTCAGSPRRRATTCA